MWRWDQGRLQYFSLDRIRRIAACITELDGVSLNADPDPLRTLLPLTVGLPFAPEHYRVWRNYARVFKILGLASTINGRLRPTSLCRRLIATGEEYLTYDAYLQFLVKVFYYPSPAFKGYNVNDTQSYPYCAILKYLIANAHNSGDPSLTVEDVFSRLIGNNVTGLEGINSYANLGASNFIGQNDQIRQVREMLVFISQLSFLSWNDSRLFIDIHALENLSSAQVEGLVSPMNGLRHEDSEFEIQRMFDISPNEESLLELKEPNTPEDLVFTEGRKIRVSHLRTERNRKVIKHYFQHAENSKLCDICRVEVAGRYPWLNNLIEVHHILPLASPLHVDRAGTSLNDLVGLCPNCHRATHSFYKIELSNENLADFVSEEHAKETYYQVKSQFLNI
ncbi:HNH endonuclease [Marinobacter antarcticus]|uniref:HNH endonuclease n=1 Tax=Marinobacter antarcticus TaxID=564117 RepID=A0A1M6UHE3_9GAMM|nr:HNH endonuclease [Marinobacter antarcticus]SHK68580.1 HNH endonuclease [Marinobacter antarcticus]